MPRFLPLFAPRREGGSLFFGLTQHQNQCAYGGESTNVDGKWAGMKGQRISSTRAEIYAMIVAMLVAQPLRIASDSKAMVPQDEDHVAKGSGMA